MNLAIIGHGKMGRLIEQLAPEYGFAVAQRLNSANNRDAGGITGNNFAGVDVALDFSTGAAGPQRRKIRAALAAEGTV
jgi:4-hydroxy-tetrahydrodipicolinate reductase